MSPCSEQSGRAASIVLHAADPARAKLVDILHAHSVEPVTADASAPISQGTVAIVHASSVDDPGRLLARICQNRPWGGILVVNEDEDRDAAPEPVVFGLVDEVLNGPVDPERLSTAVARVASTRPNPLSWTGWVPRSAIAAAAVTRLYDHARTVRCLHLRGEAGSGRRTHALALHALVGGTDWLEIDGRYERVQPRVLRDMALDRLTVHVRHAEYLDRDAVQGLQELVRNNRWRVVVSSTEPVRGLKACAVEELPSLRERPEDIGPFASYFLDLAALRSWRVGHPIERPSFTASALSIMNALAWAGNLTELAETIERAYALSRSGELGRVEVVRALPDGVSLIPHRAEEDALAQDMTRWLPRASDVLPFEEEERRILVHALEATGGHVTTAAELLAIGRATLYRKIGRYELRSLVRRQGS